MEVLQTFVVAVVTVLFGVGASWVEERLPKWEGLDSNVKQLVNAVVTFVLPTVVTAVSPYWKPEFGSIEEVLYSTVTLLVVPVGMWVVSQAAHYFDPAVLHKQRKQRLLK